MDEGRNTGEAGRKLRDTAREIGRAGIGFGRAQLIMLLVNLAVVAAGMLFAGLGYWALPVALGVSVMDMLPVVGSGLVLLPWTLVALICGEVKMALAVGLTYIAMVVIRMALDPIVTGRSIGVSPLLTLASSVAGLLLLGTVGLFVGPMIAAVASIIYRLHFKKTAQPPSPDKTGATRGATEKSAENLNKQRI